MRELKHDLTLSVPVSTAFCWFIDLDINYHRWHPVAHKKFQWLSEKPVKPGSVFMVEETIASHQHQMILRISELISNQKITFTSIRLFNGNWFLPQFFSMIIAVLFKVRITMIRQFESCPDGKTIIHLTHRLGSDISFFDKMIDFLNEGFLSSKSHMLHIIEEGEYMKKSLEI